jgi:hypothetical protein
MFKHTRSDTERETDLIRQELKFIRRGLCKRLLGLREQFEEDFSDMLKRVDTGVGTGTPCDVLSKLGDTSKKTVKDEIAVL